VLGRLTFAKVWHVGEVLPALGLTKPRPFLVGMQCGLLAAQERHGSATLSVSINPSQIVTRT
jgi:hypothetical protein